MRRLVAVAAGVAAFFALTGVANAAPQKSWAQLTAVTSASDGSQWFIVQGDVYQPGNAVWAITFPDCDQRSVGNKGIQTGAEWPADGLVFAWADGSSLALPVPVTDALDVMYAPYFEGCGSPRLVSYGNKVTVLDADVPVVF